jgi:hypothetical protein
VHDTRLLAAVSAVQLGVGLFGLAVALQRHHPYHFLMLRGRPENVRRDACSRPKVSRPPVCFENPTGQLIS